MLWVVASAALSQAQCFDEVVPSGNNLYSTSLIDGIRIVLLGEMDTWADCQAACSNGTKPCFSWTYFFANYTSPAPAVESHGTRHHEEGDTHAGSFGKKCYGRTDQYWNPQYAFGNHLVSGINCKTPPSTALPNPPPPNVQFSWDHVPVFFHTSNTTGPFNQETLELMAKFPLVTIEKYQGPDSGVHYPAEQWVCCEEDRIVQALKAVKSINPNVTGIFYYNMILDFPQYRLHQNFAKNESWWLHDDDGKVVRVGVSNLYSTLPDVYTMQLVQTGCANWRSADYAEHYRSPDLSRRRTYATQLLKPFSSWLGFKNINIVYFSAVTCDVIGNSCWISCS